MNASRTVQALNRCGHTAIGPVPLQVLLAIDRLTRENGRPPVIRELCEAMGWRSTNAPTVHLRELRRAGLLRDVPGKARALVVAVRRVEDLP